MSDHCQLQCVNILHSFQYHMIWDRKKGYCVKIHDAKKNLVYVNSKQRNITLIAVLHLKVTVRLSTQGKRSTQFMNWLERNISMGRIFLMCQYMIGCVFKFPATPLYSKLEEITLCLTQYSSQNSVVSFIERQIQSIYTVPQTISGSVTKQNI